jgi:DNA-binding PadR family transcriptional regulator
MIDLTKNVVLHVLRALTRQSVPLHDSISQQAQAGHVLNIKRIMFKQQTEVRSGQMSDENIIEELETRIVRTFLDVIVLQVLKEKGNASGYDIVLFLDQRFGKMLSSGSVYATLYGIERKGLITGMTEARKTNYKLTEKGEETLKIIQQSEAELRKFRVGSFNIRNELLKGK